MVYKTVAHACILIRRLSALTSLCGLEGQVSLATDIINAVIGYLQPSLPARRALTRVVGLEVDAGGVILTPILETLVYVLLAVLTGIPCRAVAPVGCHRFFTPATAPSFHLTTTR